MDDEAARLAAMIGARIKHERTGRGWTLDGLARSSGLSRRAVVNVEQGAANPSVGTLLRLSDALGVGLPALVAPAEHKPVTVTRAGEGAPLWTGGRGGRGVLVAGTQPPDVLELWDWTLSPGDRHESEAHAEGTLELLQVRQGSVSLNVAGERVQLHAGDAASFPGDVDHGYGNDGTEDAWFALAVFEPGVGDVRRSGSTHD